MINTQWYSLLRNPENGQPLELRQDEQDAETQWLVDLSTGVKFPIQEGIPSFVADREVLGQDAKYQRLYDRIARGYDWSENFAARVLWSGREPIRREILKEVQVRPGQRVLEVSIGTGANLQFLPAQAEYYGLDLSIGMLHQCQRNLAHWGLSANLVHGNADALPFQADAFDVVFHYGGINFFNDRAAAIREMIRVARPGTRLMIGDETEKHVKSMYEKIPYVNAFYREQVVAPIADLVPTEMRDLRYETVCDGRFYTLSFTKPE